MTSAPLRVLSTAGIALLGAACSSGPASQSAGADGGDQRGAPSGASGEGATSAAGTNGDAATSAGGCAIPQPSRRPTYVDSFFGVGIYAATANIGAAEYEDAIGIRLRTGYGYLDNIPPYEQVAGAFDLGDPIEGDYRTCRHCVFFLQDVSGDHIQVLYLATSGKLVLDSIDVDTGQATGHVEDARLVEIAATGYYEWRGPVPNGRCLSIARLDFDTRATAGGKCGDAEDCPNAVLQDCKGGACVAR